MLKQGRIKRCCSGGRIRGTVPKHVSGFCNVDFGEARQCDRPRTGAGTTRTRNELAVPLRADVAEKWLHIKAQRPQHQPRVVVLLVKRQAPQHAQPHVSQHTHDTECNNHQATRRCTFPSLIATAETLCQLFVTCRHYACIRLHPCSRNVRVTLRQ